jgi:hypothetical protein
MVGKSVRCRKCNTTIEVPEPVPAESADSLADLFDEMDWDPLKRTSAAPDQMGGSCPHCHADMPTNATLCLDCGYHQGLNRQLKSMTKLTSIHNTEGASVVTKGVGVLTVLVLLGLTAIILLVQTGMNGPQFLVLYWITFVGLWIAREFLADLDGDSWVSRLPVVLFIGIGAIRLGYGMWHDMHRFGLLIVVMVVGGFLIVAGVESLVGSRFGQYRVVRLGTPIVIGLGGIVIVLLVWVLQQRGDGYFGSHYGGGGCGGGGCGGCGG